MVNILIGAAIGCIITVVLEATLVYVLIIKGKN